MKISLETLCTNLFPHKLITCLALKFHVHSNSDSPPIPVFLCYSEHLPVHRQKLDTWMLKKNVPFHHSGCTLYFIDGLCEVINTMISEIDDLCSSTSAAVSPHEKWQHVNL